MILPRHGFATLLLLASACSGAASPAMPEPSPPSPTPTVTSTPPGPDAATAPPSALPALPARSRAGFSKWRAAIENYQPVVQLGNTAPLGEARVPFALYLNHIHNRIHPIFAEEFLRAFDSLPPDHPLNQDLSTLLEIVLEQPTGQLLRMGVVRSSGVAAFDIAALNAMARAQPFGAAPEVIASPDGRVYLHWELHRDPVDACTTRNARPYILKSVP